MCFSSAKSALLFNSSFSMISCVSTFYHPNRQNCLWSTFSSNFLTRQLFFYWVKLNFWSLMVWCLSAVLGDRFPSDNQIHPLHSFSCFNFYSISIKLHFLSSTIFLVSNSMCCLLSFSQFLGQQPAGKLPSLSSYHVILQHVTCS